MPSLSADLLDGAPTGRAEREAWLVAHAERIAAKARVALRRIVRNAYTAWTHSITASGDLGELGSIPHQWKDFVTTDLADEIAGVNMAGVMTAWVGAGERISIDTARSWAAVVNESAASYMTDATNRMVAVGESTWRQVRSQAVTAIEKGLTNEELKGRIENVTRWSEFRADTVARTETNAAYVRGELAGQQALGDDGPVEKVWVAALDARTREDHAEAHNQCVTIDEPFIVGGYSMDAPFDPSAPPSEVVNCRCVVEYLYAGDTRPDGSTIEQTDSGASSGLDTPFVPTADDLPPGEHSLLAHVDENGNLTPERQALHDQIISDTLAGHAPQENPEVLLMGGGGGAGKSTTIRSGLLQLPTDTVIVNADDLKLLLPEARDMIAAGDQSWASYTHEESSYLAKRARVEALNRGLNVTMDAVGSNAERAVAQALEAKQLGYTTRTAYVTIDADTAIARATQRFEDALAAGEPARLIDEDVLRAAHAGANAAYEQIAAAVDEAILIDNEAKPFVISTSTNGSTHIADPDAWQTFLARRTVG